MRVLCIVVLLAPGCLGAFAASQPPPGEPAAVRLDDAEHKLGPFPIEDRQFTVVLHEKQVHADVAPDPDFQSTLAALEIVDQTGVVHYRRSFPYEVAGRQFADSLSASVTRLAGTQARGLLVTYGVLPSAPISGQSWQVFGMYEGKLVPFGQPIFLDGQLMNQESDDDVVRTSREPGRQGETLEFHVWTGNFFVVYPVLVDWTRTLLAPAWRCSRMTARGPRAVCSYRMKADRVPQEEELTFVRLHAEAEEGRGTPQHIVIKADSSIELLECAGEMRWQQDEEGVGVLPGEDFWIKVRIDGHEGWIHTQEDLLALGLPQAG